MEIAISAGLSCEGLVNHLFQRRSADSDTAYTLPLYLYTCAHVGCGLRDVFRCCRRLLSGMGVHAVLVRQTDGLDIKSARSSGERGVVHFKSTIIIIRRREDFSK